MSANRRQRRALIVGARGQVGAALCAHLGGTALSSGRLPMADGGLCVDLVQLAHAPAMTDELVASLEPDAVYCVGGATDVERCESDVDWAMDTNCHGPAALAAACRHLPFVYFSTEYVFDGVSGPYREDDVAHPLSVYGRSKYEAEQRILDVHPDALVIRTTVVYGPDRQGKNFLYTLRCLLSSGQRMRVPVDQISTPTYNVDLASAACALVEQGACGIFHVCGCEVVSRFDFALQAADILGLDASLIEGLTTAELRQKAPRPLNGGLRTEKLCGVLGPDTVRINREAITDWEKLEHEKAVEEPDRAC